VWREVNKWSPSISREQGDEWNWSMRKVSLSYLKRWDLSPKGKIGSYLMFPFPKFYLIFLNAYLNFPILHLYARIFSKQFPFLNKNSENKILS
jgi:hypothetical protein